MKLRVAEKLKQIAPSVLMAAIFVAGGFTGASAAGRDADPSRLVGTEARAHSARPAQGGAVSLEEAVTIATEQVPGRVVKAETVHEDGRDIHEVLIIQEGNRVRTVRIDPESGEIL